MGTALRGRYDSGNVLNPNPSCPPAACTGVGTNSLFWGTPDLGDPPNGLAFTGRGFAVELGQPFVLGLIQYQNSSTTDNIETIDFRLQSTPTNGDPTFAQTTTLTVSDRQYCSDDQFRKPGRGR